MLLCRLYPVILNTCVPCSVSAAQVDIVVIVREVSVAAIASHNVGQKLSAVAVARRFGRRARTASLFGKRGFDVRFF